MASMRDYLRNFVRSEITLTASIATQLLVMVFGITTMTVNRLYTTTECRDVINGRNYPVLRCNYGLFRVCKSLYSGSDSCAYYSNPAPTRKFSNCTQRSSQSGVLSYGV